MSATTPSPVRCTVCGASVPPPPDGSDLARCGLCGTVAGLTGEEFARWLRWRAAVEVGYLTEVLPWEGEDGG